MAERKAVNKYYPPDWDPRKGSVNKRVGQHPLRDRARKLGQGILVIRFELPYNIWCGGCGSHVGMGVRYNAEKSKVGNYYSTPIYKFRMKCHLCDNYFEIQTDPKNHDYVILSGARRKEQRWDPVANEQVVPEDKATQKKLATDPMYKLEHGSNDQQKGKEKVMSLAQIEDSRISMKDDYMLNRMARDKFRAEKKQLREAAEADRAIVEKAALDIELVDESEEDRKLAGLMKYSVTSTFEDKQMERRKSIEQRPIFDTGGPASFSSSTPLSSSSSSSSSPGNPQHHKLSLSTPSSKHGDLKQKLGRVLQASYKDPFTSGVVKQKHTAIPFSSQRPSQLGIKLKSAVKPKSGKHAGVAKTTDNKSHLSKTSSKINQPSVRSLSPARTVGDNSSSTSVPSNNSTEAPPSSSASSRPKTCNQVSNISSASVQSPSSTDSPVCASANGSFQEYTTAESNSLSCDITDKASEKISRVSQGELETREPSETNSDLTLGSSENTGLQTLISSYGDSDSDSNP